MDLEPNKSVTHFYERISALLNEYTEAKEAILLSEKFDPNNELYIAPLNELRSAFDHIMRAVAFPNELDYQFKEASSHIKRAAYDAYEIFNINLINSQLDSVKKYNSDVISHIFPEYYTDCVPLMNEIKFETAKIRAHKKVISSENTTHFEDYFSLSKKLLGLNDLFSKKIPGLEEYSKRSIREKIRSQFWYWLGSILLVGLSYYLGKYK